jgi:hypothetical protein
MLQLSGRDPYDSALGGGLFFFLTTAPETKSLCELQSSLVRAEI